MGVQLDILIPPIILGLLITMILSINFFILETSVDNRLTNEVQMQSVVTLEVIEEEMRGLSSFAAEPNEALLFFTFTGDSVSIDRDNRRLRIIRKNMATQQTDTTIYGLNLSDLQFSAQPDTIAFTFATFLRVNVETHSRPDQHARFRDNETPVRAFAEKEFFLRNRAAALSN